MATSVEVRQARALRLMRDGGLTFAAVLLAFAAFDDITTDNDIDFTLEYGALAVCGVWLFFMAVRLMRDRRYALGGVSLGVLLAAALSQPAIEPGILPGLWTEYLVVAGAFLWFAALSMILLSLGWQAHPGRHNPSDPLRGGGE